MIEEPSARLTGQQNAGPTVVLSLFLLLLAFFILLNSLATIEDTKSKQVLYSMASSFRAPTETDTSVEVLISELGPTPEPEDLLRTMRRLWVTSVPVAEVDILTPGRVMQMTMPANELFIGDRAELRSDRRRLFGNMAKVLARTAPGLQSELQAVFGSAAVSGAILRGGGNLPMRRAAVFAEELVAYSAPAATLAVGIREGAAKSVRLRFSIRDAARMRIDFRNAAQ